MPKSTNVNRKKKKKKKKKKKMLVISCKFIIYEVCMRRNILKSLLYAETDDY